IGIVAMAEGALLQPQLKAGQRLVSPEGHLWRWDGFVVHADVSAAAANRLAERSRLGRWPSRRRACAPAPRRRAPPPDWRKRACTTRKTKSGGCANAGAMPRLNSRPPATP